jgi:hypothetical protein
MIGRRIKMAIDNEYFILTPVRPVDKAGGPTPSPNIIKDSDCPPYTREKNYIENPQKMFFCFGKGTTKSPRMIDYHTTPHPLISEKLYSALNAMNIKGIQLIPAVIRGKNENYNYWYLHIYNAYPVLDIEKSECEWDDFLKKVMFIDTIVFKENELEKIKLEDRLIFKLAEDGLEFFFHKSIVDELLKIEPKSFKFTNVTEYKA